MWLLVTIMVAWAAYSYFSFRRGKQAIGQTPAVGAETLIGMKCRTTEPLSPYGYVRVGPELWRARSIAGNIDPGTGVELADEETVRRYVEDLRTLLVKSRLTERRSFIRSFVKEVKVAADQVVVTYTIPMPPKGLTEEGILVPPTIQHGGRYRT